MLENINPRYHAYLQASVPQEQWTAFAGITAEEQEHHYGVWLAQQPQLLDGQGNPIGQQAQTNPLSGTTLMVNPDTQEITVSDKDNQFKEFGLIKSIYDLERIAVHVSNSNIGAKEYRGNPAAAFSVLMYGYEMKINPMVAIYAMHLIEGKPSASIHLIRSLLERAGVEIETKKRFEYVYDSLGNAVDIESHVYFYRMSRMRRTIIQGDYRLTWNMATEAKWTGRGQWKTMGFIMLPTRTTTLGGREFYGSALNGMFELSELNPDVEYDEDLNMRT